MMREYYTFQSLGIPMGIAIGGPIYVAQDAFTREYHVASAAEFKSLASRRWIDDEVMSISYTGAFGCIDPPTQTVSHTYDPKTTTEDELRNFDALVVRELTRLIPS